MALQKKDFVEIEFTGRVKGGEVFDSNTKEELEKLHAGHDHPIELKPLTLCLGQSMFLKSVEDFLIGKEIGKTYDIELEPENAFGKRDSTYVYTMPLKIFREKNIRPVVGATFNFDGKVGKVLTVSGGRVIIDFNHFLAGKTVTYQIKVLKKVDDLNDKVKAVNEFFFRQDLKFDIEGKKLTIEVEKPLVKIIELFKDKFKEILDLDLEVKEAPEVKTK